MPRKKSKTGKKITQRLCNGCDVLFLGTERWKAHLKTSPQCTDKHYPCNHCHSGFCGFDAVALDKHFYSSNTCKTKHASFLAGTIGKLPPGTADRTLSTQQKKDCNNYSFEALAPDGTTANICVEFEDTTEERMSGLRMMPFSSHMVDGSNFMSNLKSYAGMVANGMGCHIMTWTLMTNLLRVF